MIPRFRKEQTQSQERSQVLRLARIANGSSSLSESIAKGCYDTYLRPTILRSDLGTAVTPESEKEMLTLTSSLLDDLSKCSGKAYVS